MSSVSRSDEAEFLSDLLKLAQKMEDTASVVRQAHFLAADRWEKVNFSLGLATVLIGVVGGTGSVAATNLTAAGVFATIAGLLGAANSFLKPADRVEKHKRAGDDWSILRDRAADLYQLKMRLPHVKNDQLQKNYELLLKNKEEITRSSPIVPAWAYDDARNVREKDNKKEIDETKSRSRNV